MRNEPLHVRALRAKVEEIKEAQRQLAANASSMTLEELAAESDRITDAILTVIREWHEVQTALRERCDTDRANRLNFNWIAERLLQVRRQTG